MDGFFLFKRLIDQLTNGFSKSINKPESST